MNTLPFRRRKSDGVITPSKEETTVDPPSPQVEQVEEEKPQTSQDPVAPVAEEHPLFIVGPGRRGRGNAQRIAPVVDERPLWQKLYERIARLPQKIQRNPQKYIIAAALILVIPLSLYGYRRLTAKPQVSLPDDPGYGIELNTADTVTAHAPAPKSVDSERRYRDSLQKARRIQAQHEIDSLKAWVADSVVKAVQAKTAQRAPAAKKPKMAPPAPTTRRTTTRRVAPPPPRKTVVPEVEVKVPHMRVNTKPILPIPTRIPDGTPGIEP